MINMKKTLGIGLIIIVSLVLIAGLLNLTVTTRQCVNYECRVIKMPFYLKTLDFYDRHFNYKFLVQGIIKGVKSEEERAMRLFSWTCDHIRQRPETLPIMDDHVWYTIIRGYGIRDQYQDVFTTLCNYAGLKAYYTNISSKKENKKIPLSFVRIGDKWFIFDVSCGVYFKNRAGGLADINAVRSGNWVLSRINSYNEVDVDYRDFIDNFPASYQDGLRRANIQSPINRLLFEIKNAFLKTEKEP